MRWRRGQSSDYVVDRRGRRAAGGIAVGGLGGIGVLVVVLLQVLGGGGGGGSVPGLDDIIGQLGGAPTGPAEADPNIEQGTGGQADDELEDFMRAVMNDLQASWTEHFTTDFDRTYEPTQLVLFTQSVSTGGCGNATSAVGPFYCPPDRLAYIDLDFFRDLASRFGAPGEFAQAYVIAHEVGHHVQNLLGVTGGGQESNDRSVRVELQADCYAGVWANGVFEEGDLEEGDLEEGLDAAAAVGDDRLSPGSGSESWTHGSSEQRVRWFRAGFASGDPADCDTFSADER